MPAQAATHLWTHPATILSSLEPLETTVPIAVSASSVVPATSIPAGVSFRHSGWSRPRQLIQAALHRTGASEARRERFNECGAYSWIFRSKTDPDHFKISGSFCRDRFCTPCANARSRLIANNLRGCLKNPPYRFVTLTLRTDNEPLSELINLLLKSFRALRLTSWWGERVTGGVGFVEVTYNPARSRWHPHLHLIIAGTYLDSQELRAHWWRITQHSFIVDVRAIRDTETTLRYVTKYASKPLGNSFINRPAQLDEAIVALSGRRLCHTFGAWRGLQLFAITDQTEWERVCSLTDFLTAAYHCEPWALRLYHKYTGHFPTVTNASARAPPPADATAT